MRLLVIYRYLILGGVTTQLVNRLRFLEDKVEAHFAYLKDYGGRSAFGGYPHVHLFHSHHELAQFIRDESFDLVAVIDTPEAYQALAEAEYTGPVLHEVHTTTQQVSYLGQLDLEKIEAFLVPSHYVAQHLKNLWPALDKPCYVVPNCLDTAHFAPVALGEDVESELVRKIILWVGKLDQHKNWPLFLEVAQQVIQRGYDCQFWMVGGETAKPQTVLELMSAAEERGLLGRLHWFSRVEYHLMPKVYSMAGASGGLSLSTSRNESFGMTVLESLACGCPPLAPDVGALGEVLDGELATCLYSSAQAEVIADRAIQLLDDEDLRHRIIQAGQAKIKGRYSIDAAAEQYYRTLLQIVH